MTQHDPRRLTTSCAFFPSNFRQFIYLKFPFSFRKSRVIGPLHMSGPVSVSTDAQRIVTCVRDKPLLTDLATGDEVCRFATVCVPQYFDTPFYSTFLGLDCGHSSGNHSRWQPPCRRLFILIYTHLFTSSPPFFPLYQTSSSYTRHSQSP